MLRSRRRSPERRTTKSRPPPLVGGGRRRWRFRVMKISRLLVRVFVPSLLVVLVIMASGCQDNEIVVYGELPENVGYLHSGTPRLGQLTIFDADTFEVYRSVELPITWESYSHRLELDPMGRIWIGYAQDGMSRRGRHSGVQVLSPRGELEHDLDLGCAPPRLCTIKRHRLACRASCGTRGAGLLSIRARARTA